MKRNCIVAAIILSFWAAFSAFAGEPEWVSRKKQVFTLNKEIPAKIDRETHNIDLTATDYENADVHWVEYYGYSIFRDGFFINTCASRRGASQSHYGFETKKIELTLGRSVYCFNVLDVNPDYIKLELYGVYKTREEKSS